MLLDGIAPFICWSVFYVFVFMHNINTYPQIIKFEERIIIEKLIVLFRPFEEISKELSAANVSVS